MLKKIIGIIRDYFHIKICLSDNEKIYFVLPGTGLKYRCEYKDFKMLNGMRFNFKDYKELFNKFCKLKSLNKEIELLESEYTDSRYDDWKEIDYEIKGNFMNKEEMIEDLKNEKMRYFGFKIHQLLSNREKENKKIER